ncbi:hypothetical protein DWA37_26195 [Klebsiella pneumoniae]|nr:hypothetical protein DWA37_26195 [Klebsiella pneumoniae]HBY0837139.1 hypothetical protein [Klebsiella pneumoniae]
MAAAELMPVLNASDAASEGFAAACLLPKIRAQRLRSAARAFFTALLSLRSSSPSSSESSLSSAASGSSPSSSASSSRSSSSASSSRSSSSASSSRSSSSARRPFAFLAFLSSSSSEEVAPRPIR